MNALWLWLAKRVDCRSGGESEWLPGPAHDDWTALDHSLYEAVWHRDVPWANCELSTRDKRRLRPSPCIPFIYPSIWRRGLTATLDLRLDLAYGSMLLR